MKIVIAWVFLILMTFSSNLFAGQLSEIELIDGGVILGEIISKSDGVYVVKSESLGTLKVKESEIRFIRVESAGDITTLMSNPKFIELLNNPEIKEIQKKVLTP